MLMEFLNVNESCYVHFKEDKNAVKVTSTPLVLGIIWLVAFKWLWNFIISDKFNRYFDSNEHAGFWIFPKTT